MRMKTLAVNRISPAGARGKTRLPVPRNAPDEGRPDSPAPRPAAVGGGRLPGRPAAPFLAQLFLQHDGVEAARRTRAERKRAAARAYATALSRRGARPVRPLCEVKV